MLTGFSLLSSRRFSLVRHFTARSPVLTESGPVPANLLEAWGLKGARQNKLLEKSRFTLTKNGRREFVRRDQVSPYFPFTLYCFYTKISSFIPAISVLEAISEGIWRKACLGVLPDCTPNVNSRMKIGFPQTVGNRAW